MKGLPRLCERLSLELQQALDRVRLLSKEDSLSAAAAQISFIKEQTARANEVVGYEILPLLKREADKKAPVESEVVTESTVGNVAKKPGES